MSADAGRIAARLKRERGTIYKQGRRALVLTYPSPYRVGMSSLGFQQVYRLLNLLPDTVAERSFLPDEDEAASGSVLAYESGRPIADFPVIAFSVACEFELMGLFEVLERSGVPLLARERDARHPYVVCGGPLTIANPLPLAAFADVVVMGESEDLLEPLCDTLFASPSRKSALMRLASLPGFFVPEHHGEVLPEPFVATPASLPAASVIITEEAALSSMWLVEAERGCARGCAFCVMRRGGAHGMRLCAPERIYELLPPEARRVGLVGAAVSDHPKLGELVEHFVDLGLEVGVSSLRADRVSRELLTLLMRGGQRTLTVAADGASERLRGALQKGITCEHLLAVAELTRELMVPQLKCYVMLGVPEETDGDIDEFAKLVRHMAKVVGRQTKVVITASTFVPKRRTPLAAAPFCGVQVATLRLARLRRALFGVATVKGDSPRWAYVEHALAQGGKEEGLRALEAFRCGGSYGAFRRAFAGLLT